MRHLILIKADVKLSDKKKGVGLPHVRRTYFKGLPVDIELDIGMTASGKEPDGKPWSVTYKHPYGEIPRTEGRDGDPVDVYIGPEEDAPLVYVVHQVKRNGAYDEDKCFLGFDSAIEATRCYFEHGPRWGLGSVESLTWNEFLNGYLVGARKHGDPKLVVEL